MDRREDGDDPVGSLLLGVIDDGCPFAAAHFLKSTSGVGIRTRVRGIWDQNFGRLPINVNDKDGLPCVFGKTLGDLKYGLEFLRASDAPGAASPRQMGLNEWIELHVTPQGSVDEDGCYADAGFPGLAHHASHGAHIMDLFAGRIPTSSRIGPFRGDRRDPPSWSVGADSASDDSTDVVFVQFPTQCLRDATGVWLKSYVHDAILYILSHAGFDEARSRGDKPQLRAYDRTAQWFGRTGNVPDDVRQINTTASMRSSSSRSCSLQAIPICFRITLLSAGPVVSPTMSNGLGGFLPTTPLCASRKCGSKQPMPPLSRSL